MGKHREIKYVSMALCAAVAGYVAKKAYCAVKACGRDETYLEPRIDDIIFDPERALPRGYDGPVMSRSFDSQHRKANSRLLHALLRYMNKLNALR